MSENRGRRRIRVGAPGRVGEPNVLSNAAAPNTLSGTEARPAQVQVGTTPQAGSRNSATGSRRLPSFGTLLFIGFLILTGLRLLGEFVQGMAQQEPAPTTAPAPVQGIEPGAIVFGSKSDGDCGVLETATEFAQATEVWWSAKLPAVQSGDVAVVIIVRRDGEEVDREDVPPDPDAGDWSILCSGAPVGDRSPGRYRVEVWDQTITVLQAAGEYRVSES